MEAGAVEAVANVGGVDAPLGVQEVGGEGVADFPWEVVDVGGRWVPAFAECFEDRTELGVGELGGGAVEDGVVPLEDARQTRRTEVAVAGEGEGAVEGVAGGDGDFQGTAAGFGRRESALAVIMDLELPRCAPAPWTEVGRVLTTLSQNWERWQYAGGVGRFEKVSDGETLRRTCRSVQICRKCGDCADVATSWLCRGLFRKVDWIAKLAALQSFLNNAGDSADLLTSCRLSEILNNLPTYATL